MNPKVQRSDLCPVLLNVIDALVRMPLGEDDEVKNEHGSTQLCEQIESQPQESARSSMPATRRTSKKTDQLTIRWHFAGNMPNGTV